MNSQEMKNIEGGKFLGWTNQGGLQTYATSPNYPPSMDATGYHQEYEILWIEIGQE